MFNNLEVLRPQLISGRNLQPSILSHLFLPGSRAVVSEVNHVMNHSLAKHAHISHHSKVSAPQRSLDERPFKSERSHSVSESTPLRHRSSSIRSSSSRCFQQSPRHGGQPLLAILVDSRAFLGLRGESTKTLPLSQTLTAQSSLQRGTRGERCALSISSSQIQGEASWFRFHPTVFTQMGCFFMLMLEVYWGFRGGATAALNFRSS